MAEPVFTGETFRFFRDLARNNRTAWMDANRDRYRNCIVAPLKILLHSLAPAAQKLDRDFDVSGRPGSNFSRINRDIRFAADKTPYRTQMYLKFSNADGRDDGELYVGVSADAVTAGFRIYHGGRDGRLAQVGIPRARTNTKWLQRQVHRLQPKYESYWYTNEKGNWTKHDGWPTAPEEWKRLKAWVVRRKMKAAAAKLPAFVAEIEKVFREVFPLYRFTSASSWRP